MTWRGIWNADAVYAPGDSVGYASTVWVASVTNTGQVPVPSMYWTAQGVLSGRASPRRSMFAVLLAACAVLLSRLTGRDDLPEPAATSTAEDVSHVAGDLSGTAATPVVVGIQGTPVDALPGGTTKFLRSDGTWEVPSGSNFAGLLTPTSVQTADYTANPGDYVICNASSAFTVTLPTAPANFTTVGAKVVAQTGANAITLQLGGSDVFNVAGGSRTGTLKLLDQGIILQYAATPAIWYVFGDDLPLIQVDARYVRQAQAQPTSSGSGVNFDQWTVTPEGDTNTLANYTSTFGANTAGGVKTTPWFWGYNTPQSATYTSAESTMMCVFYPDAGDTLSDEFGLFAKASAVNGGWSQDAIFIASKRDSTHTLDINFNCGASSTSQISFTDANRNSYLAMGPGYRGVLAEMPVFSIAPVSGAPTLKLTAPSGQGAVINLNAGSAVTSNITFQQANSDVWQVQATGGGLFNIFDSANSRHALAMYAGTANTGKAVFTGSVVISTGALATTATGGFLYIPTCAGAPTGTPSAQAGTVPLIYDTTNSRLYLYESAAWHYIGMTA